MQLEELQRPVIFHTKLNPLLWQDEQLRPEVRQNLIDHAAAFIKSLKVDNLPLVDVIITGSNTNYTYTEHSDLDLHIIVDMQKVYSGGDLVEKFFDSKRRLWNQTYDITVRGITVEIYVEDDDDGLVGNAYSVIKDQWLKRQPLTVTQYDDRSVRTKTRSLMRVIDRALKRADSVADLDQILAKLAQYRQSGLDQHGEFSTENLVYKTLRNEGYLDSIRQRRIELTNSQLSLKEKTNISV